MKDIYVYDDTIIIQWYLYIYTTSSLPLFLVGFFLCSVLSKIRIRAVITKIMSVFTKIREAFLEIINIILA